MSWQKTSCALCALNCGLEVRVEDNHIVKVRPDKDNPRSEGYVCRKGLNIAHNQHNADRLYHPLKRVGNDFEEISWEQATGEIAERLKRILGKHGPRSLAAILSGQGCHTGLTFAGGLVGGLGSQYVYTALGQEYTGRYYAHGLTLGNQGLVFAADFHETDMVLCVGWNPMMSHGTPQARRKLTRISKNPDKLLVVLDPRLSETAKIADIHLALRPGTDALLLRAMIGLIIKEGWQAGEYIESHMNGFAEAAPWFTDFDIQAALNVCELDYAMVYDVCREFASRKSCLKDDLGILMGRHSTLVSYLLVVLQAVCGRIGTPGGNYLASQMTGGPGHSDVNDPNIWRTVATDIPAIGGIFPPNVMPEEIMSGHPDRLRAVIVAGANPVRSYADTPAYEAAFKELELLVTAEMAMSETARLSHYVLPSRSAYESYDTAHFPWMNWPEIFYQMRRPVVEVRDQQREMGEIFTHLADAIGLIPDIPESLYGAANGGDLRAYRDALMGYIMENPAAMPAIPYVAAKTLGPALGSVHLSALLIMLQARSERHQQEAARAGFALGPDQGIEMFEAIMAHPEGLWVGKADPDTNLEKLETDDKKIHIHVSEFEAWMDEIDPSLEEEALELGEKYPLIMLAGHHMDTNANTIMRNPEWNKGRRDCTVLVNPIDADRFDLTDGQTVRVSTEAGSEEIEVEVSEGTRPGMVVIPHGFGLDYDGVKHGANVNRLTKNTHRDRVAATPLHRYVPCRLDS